MGVLGSMERDEMRRLLADAARGANDARKHLGSQEQALAYINGALAKLVVVAAELRNRECEELREAQDRVVRLVGGEG